MELKEQQQRSYQEMQSLSAALACLSVVYAIMPRLPKGLPRVFCVLACLPILAKVPFSTRHHFLRSIFSFSFLWVCPTKLLLRSWDIAPDYPDNGFLYFIVTSLMPLRVRGRSHSPKLHDNVQNPASDCAFQGPLLVPLLQLLCFCAVLNLVWNPSISSGWIHHGLYCLLVYFGLEGVLGLFSKFTSVLLGLDLHPFFDKPLLASSLSEFWGRRWNRLASYMLRETVYVPILHFLSAEARSREFGHTDASTGSPQSQSVPNVNGRTDASKEWEPALQSAGKVPLLARAIAMFATFVASGLFHELLYYCITQTSATWEVTMFFILHGIASVLEVFLTRKFPSRKKLPQPIAIACTLAFLYISAAWLFMPPLIRSGADLRILAEISGLQNAVVDLFSRYWESVNIYVHDAL